MNNTVKNDLLDFPR